MTVLAAQSWNTNADLIVDVARLGYLRPEWVTLDPTYGRGLWWKKWKPEMLISRDRKHDEGWDFRTMLGIDDESIDAVAFDPPYVAQGGRKTIGIQADDFTDRFGMRHCAATPEEVATDIARGMHAAQHKLKPGGILLVKCKNYVSSGKLFPGVHQALRDAMLLGFEYVDELTMVAGTGPQPKTNPNGTPRRQVHARQNSSTLFVFRKPKPRKVKK